MSQVIPGHFHLQLVISLGNTCASEFQDTIREGLAVTSDPMVIFDLQLIIILGNTCASEDGEAQRI